MPLSWIFFATSTYLVAIGSYKMISWPASKETQTSRPQAKPATDSGQKVSSWFKAELMPAFANPRFQEQVEHEAFPSTFAIFL